MFRFKEEWAIFSFPYSSISSSLKLICYIQPTHIYKFFYIPNGLNEKDLLCSLFYFVPTSSILQRICNLQCTCKKPALLNTFKFHSTQDSHRKEKVKRNVHTTHFYILDFLHLHDTHTVFRRE